MTQGNLDDSRFAEGINQLRTAVDCKSLTKGEAGIHVLGSLLLKNFNNDSDSFFDEMVNTLNKVCAGSTAKFRGSLSLGPTAHEVLSGFASEKNLEVLSAGWLELVDLDDCQTDKRLLGVFMLPNGRKGVGIFQLLH